MLNHPRQQDAPPSNHPHPPSNPELYGIGLMFRHDTQGLVRICGIQPDGPAAESKMLSIDDVLLAVDGKNVAGLSIQSIRNLLVGLFGTTVVLDVQKAQSQTASHGVHFGVFSSTPSTRRIRVQLKRTYKPSPLPQANNVEQAADATGGPSASETREASAAQQHLHPSDTRDAGVLKDQQDGKMHRDERPEGNGSAPLKADPEEIDATGVNGSSEAVETKFHGEVHEASEAQGGQKESGFSENDSAAAEDEVKGRGEEEKEDMHAATDQVKEGQFQEKDVELAEKQVETDEKGEERPEASEGQERQQDGDGESTLEGEEKEAEAVVEEQDLGIKEESQEVAKPEAVEERCEGEKEVELGEAGEEAHAEAEDGQNGQEVVEAQARDEDESAAKEREEEMSEVTSKNAEEVEEPGASAAKQQGAEGGGRDVASPAPKEANLSVEISSGLKEVDGGQTAKEASQLLKAEQERSRNSGTPRAVSMLNRKDLHELKTFKVPSSPCMLRINGSRFPCVSRVPCSSSLLATNAVSVVWCPSGRILVWHGASSSAQERVKALEIASALKDIEHCARGKIQRVEEGDEEGDFWELVGPPLTEKKVSSLPDESSYWSAMEVYGWREEDERVEVSERPLRQQILRSDSSFVIASSFIGIFVWVGRESSQAAAEAARAEADAMAAKMRRSTRNRASNGNHAGEEGDEERANMDGEEHDCSTEEEKGRAEDGAEHCVEGTGGEEGVAEGGEQREDDEEENVQEEEAGQEEEDSSTGGREGGEEVEFEVETVLEGWEHSIFKSLFVDWLTACGTSSKQQVAASSPIVDGKQLGRQARATMTPTSKGVRRRSDGHVELVCVQGRRFITARSIDPVAAAVNNRDIFILDTGRCVYQRNGRQSSPQAKAKAAEICLAYVQMHAGKALHVVLDPDDDKEQTGDSLEFWNRLGGRGNDRGTEEEEEEEAAPDESEIKSRIKLWKVGDGGEAMKEIPRPYRQSCLCSDGAFVLSWEEEQLFVWTGNIASTKTKQKAFDWAAELQRETEKKKKKLVAVEAAVQYGEPPLFRSHFIGWISDRLPDRSRPEEKASHEPANLKLDSTKILEKRASEIDLEAMEGSGGATLPLITPAVKHDDGSTGSCRVWVVEQGRLKEVEAEVEKGREEENETASRPLVLDSRHCYVMRYTYCPGIDRQQTRSITYVWQGRWAGRASVAAAVMSMNEVSASSTSAFHDDKEVVQEGKESQHFLIAMGKALIITPAEHTDEGRTEQRSRLFMVCDFGDAPSSGAAVGMAVEVKARMESFYSGACYFLIPSQEEAGGKGSSVVYVWMGTVARQPMRALAETCARALVTADVEVKQVEEGEETKEFLKCLGDAEKMSNYARVNLNDGGRAAGEQLMGLTRLFHFEMAGTMVRPREVARPSAPDLLEAPTGICMVDRADPKRLSGSLYVWYERDCSEQRLQSCLSVAKRYLDARNRRLQSQGASTENYDEEPTLIKQGEETADFFRCFIGMDRSFQLQDRPALPSFLSS